MPAYFNQNDIDYYVGKLTNEGIPLFAENGWNYFAHNFEKYMANNGRPYSSIDDMLNASLNDAISARANTFDFRVPEDAEEWMQRPELVEKFINEGGYRFVPKSFTIPTEINSNNYFIVESRWKNTGIGRIPNNRPAWDYKYKVAYALLDKNSKEPVSTHVTDIDPSEWLKGSNYSYETNVSFGNIPDGDYDFAFAIVDTTKDNQPAINLAINDEKTETNWYTTGEVVVSNIENSDSKSTLESYKLSKDFDNVQGKNQWYYLEGQSQPFDEMHWNEDEKLWRGSYHYTLIKPNAYVHPSNNDTVIGWKAPKDGDIRLVGNPRKQNVADGDGIKVKILKNEEKIWPENNEWRQINANDNEGFNHDLILSVEKDDMLYFIVNKNGSDASDGSIWDPKIIYRSGLESLPEVNVEPLKTLIEQAKGFKNEDNKYTASSFAALQAAIESAEASLATIETEDALRAALKELDSAISNLNETVDGLENFAKIAEVSTDMGSRIGKIENILDDSTEAWGASVTAEFPGYITFDLNSTSVDLERIDLTSMYGKDQGITNLDIEYHDGEEWVTAKSSVNLDWKTSDTTPEELTVKFDSFTTNKVRLKINAGNITWGQIALMQVKLLGKRKASIGVSSLEALIEEAKKLTNEDNKYTASSFAALQAAIESAEASLATIETGEDLHLALTALQNAIDALEQEEESKIPEEGKENNNSSNNGGVSLDKDLEDKENLPATGTKASDSFLLFGAILLIAGLFIYKINFKQES